MTVPEDFPINTDQVASGDYKGFPWVAARAPLYGAVNGYVRLPDGHPWLAVEENYYIENSIPWGEITFKQGNWIGFDTLHSGQHWPSEDIHNRRWDHDTVMTEAMVIGWAEQLAQEAHAFAANGTYEI